VPRRLRESKRRDRRRPTIQQWLVEGLYPRLANRRVVHAIAEDWNLDGPTYADVYAQVRAVWQAWNGEHGRAWRLQQGRPTLTDWLSAYELLTGETTRHVPTAQAEVERLLAAGVGHAVLDLDREHPDPPGWAEAGRAA
jgi:hypothetical protein